MAWGRNLRNGLVLLGLSFATALAQTAPSPVTTLPATPEAWSSVAQEDIRQAALITQENHPGYVDPRNPQFKTLLAQAERNGLLLARDVTNAAGYVGALRRFSNTLQDGHAGAYPTLDNAALPKTKWPGFVAVWRGNGAFVYNSQAGGPARGAQIMACDGINIEDLALRNVFAFRGRPTEPGNWWVEVRRVFMDGGNPFVTPPRTCQFRENGAVVPRDLAWRETDETFNRWRDDSYNGVTLPVGMTKRDSGIVWIAMPEFQPNPDQQATYRAIAAQIEADRPSVSNAKAIVLDLRDNQGGSSVWSKIIADALWGNGLRNALMTRYNAGRSAILWRTSQGNARHVEAQVARFKTQGLDALAQEWTAIYQGMDAARERGEVLFEEGSNAQNQSQTRSRPRPVRGLELKAPVYVIVPGQCASACLDAVDVFTRFQNVKLIGAPSSADSTYMDIRSQALPSGLGAVIIPNKVYVGRPRGAGFAYRPAIEVRDLDWSTEAFEKVVLDDVVRRVRR
jgi:hypothetical protein